MTPTLPRTSTLPPRTGNQFSIEAAGYRATITQQGATLRRLTYRGKNVIVPFDADDIPVASQGQLLVPFPNRLADGEYTFEGVRHTLPLDEHDRRTAIHGFGHRHMWTLVRAEKSLVRLAWRIPAMPGYPFDLVVEATYTVSERGLNLAVSAWNHGDVDAPWAVGLHPWIANGEDSHGDRIETDNGRCVLDVPARTHVVTDGRLLPTGTEPVEGTIYDLRHPTMMAGRHFDDAWTDLSRDDSGGASASLTRPDGMTVRIRGDATITSFQICTGTGFSPQMRPAGIAVEPQTAYANALNSGIGLMVVRPNERAETTICISAHMTQIPDNNTSREGVVPVRGLCDNSEGSSTVK